MNRRDCVHGLDLHDDKILYQQINSISDFEFYTAIDNRKPDLACGLDTRLVQFVMQTGLIGALE